MSDELLQKAIQLAKSQNREAAIPLLLHILKAEPENADAWDSLLNLLGDDQRRAVLNALVRKNLGGPAAREVLDTISDEDLRPYLAQGNAESEAGDPPDAGEQALDPVPTEPGEWLPEAAVGDAPDSAGASQAEEPATLEPAPEVPAEDAVPPMVEPPAVQEMDAAMPEALTAEAPTAEVSVDSAPDVQASPGEVLPAESADSTPDAGEDPLRELRALSQASQEENHAAGAWKPEWQAAAAEAPPAAENAVAAASSLRAQTRPAARSTQTTRRSRRRGQTGCLVAALALLLVVILSGVVGVVLWQRGLIDPGFAPALAPVVPEATRTPAPSATQVSLFDPTAVPNMTATPTATAEPSATSAPTQTPLPSPTSTPYAGQVIRSTLDGASLVFVPAGGFQMGWNFGDPGETTVHTVNLDAFLIDLTEVTNKMYAACVAAGACTPPAESKSYKRADYYANPDFAAFPVVYVNWQQAADYCAWAGRRLPSEAEWEFAARGTDGRLFPWGKEAPNRDLANFEFLNQDTTAVGSFPAGASPFGVLDMAGNAAEWVNDWYIENYYARAPKENPPGPAEGVLKVFRGGSFANQADKLRSTRRGFDQPVFTSSSLGFRCAQSAAQP